jgi:hypothetical protein
MTKLRLFFAVAALSFALSACSSPAGLDCTAGDGLCQTLGPGGNGLGPGGNGLGPGGNGLGPGGNG